MKRKWFLTFIFPFLWCILSGFNPPQDQKQVETITKSDSVTVNLTFQNPQLDLVVKDQRSMDAIQEIIKGIKDSDNAVANAINSVKDGYLSVAERDQERRYESAMDYLIRKSSYTSTEDRKSVV